MRSNDSPAVHGQDDDRPADHARGRVLGRVITLAVFAAAFAVLLALVELKWSSLHRLDLDVASSLHRVALAHPDQTAWWRGVSDVLHPTVLRIVAALAALALWFTQRRTAAVFVVVAVAGAAAIESLTKSAVARTRPVLDHPVAHGAGGSFPSGHAMTSLVCAGVLAILVAPRFRIPAIAAGFVAAALVAYSRLALGVHYFSDVLGAWLFGIAWLLAVEWAFAARLRGPVTDRDVTDPDVSEPDVTEPDVSRPDSA